jgi:methyl-accepting chemotaxis protein
LPRTDQPDLRSSLKDQIPEAGFPAGVGVPSLVSLLLLLALSAFCVVHLSAPQPQAVVPAVVQAQERLAANTARSIAASAMDGAHDLSTAGAATHATGSGDAAGLVNAVGRSDDRWRGVALVDRSAGSVLAQQGEVIPVNLLPAPTTSQLTVFPVPRPSGDLLLVTYLPLSGDKSPSRALVASRTLRVPKLQIDEGLRQGVLVFASSGALVSGQGNVPDQADRAVNGLVQQARAAAAAGTTGTLTGPAGPTSAPVVAYAPVASDDAASAGLGLSLISVVRAPLATPAPFWSGLVPATALAVVALLGFVLLGSTLVRPVRRLRAEALTIAAGRLDNVVRLPASPELRAIATAFNHVRARLHNGRRRRAAPPRGLSIRAALTVVTAALLAWSASVVLLFGRGAADVPEQVVRDAERQTSTAAEAVRRTLNEGVADLRTVAKSAAGTDAPTLQPALEELAGRQSRYRSVYITDTGGQVVTRAARDPLRGPTAPPGTEGVSLHKDVERVPTIYAHVPLPGGTHTLMAEYDVEYLSELLAHSKPGRSRIVDAELRVVLDTRGFLPFTALGDEAARHAAAQALEGGSSADRTKDGRDALVSAASLRGGAAGELKWAVVGEQPVTELGLVENELRRGAILVALLAALVALLQVGWHHFVLVRPLRLAARSARQIVAGDTATTVYPQRQDEIGTIASCLEICRQALVDGAGRLGHVRRPSGAATDATVMIPRITDDADPSRSPDGTNRPTTTSRERG